MIVAGLSITAFSESWRNPSVLWVGTDDGNVQLTTNGGITWVNVRENIPNVPSGIWVSSLEASHFNAGTCYVTFDGHRSDDLSPWIFKTTDFGQTWTKVTHNIPEGQVIYVIKEDQKNENLLFAGSEFACFTSLNGGDSWVRLMNNMPTVAFHDLVIHPRDGDLVAGTHGRSFWVLDDITPLQQLTDEILASEAHLFKNRPMTIWEDATRGGVRGHMFFAGENPPYIPKREDIVRAKLISGGLINYYLKSTSREDVVLEITDIADKFKRHLPASKEAGINRVLWDFRFDPTPEQRKRFIAGMKEVYETLLGIPNLAKELKEWIDKEKKGFEKATEPKNSDEHTSSS